VKLGSKTFWKMSGGIIGLLVVLAILIAANVIFGRLRLRADLTEEKLYTLSDGTRRVLANMDRQVALKLFFNSSAPEMPVYLKSYARQVEDLLHEYRLAAGRRITVETYDPEPDSQAEEWAQRYGLEGQQLGIGGPAVYFGLVAVCGDVEAIIPNLDPRAQEMLEYNITRTLYRVTHPTKPVIGVMSSLPVLGSGQQQFPIPGQPRPPQQEAWTALNELRQDFDLRPVEPETDSIGNEISALLLIHPKTLSDRTLYALDQFVLRGGRLLAFVDPLCIADLESQQSPNPYGRPESSSNLERLFKAWGVRFDPAQVVADMSAASRVRAANNRIEESLVWLSLARQHVDAQDIVTAKLETMMLPFAGSFANENAEGLVFTPLLQSSELSGPVSAMSAQFGGDALKREFREGGMRLALAARLTGTFKSAFPEGKPTAEKKEGEAAPAADTNATHLAEGKSAVVVVGDVDMIWDRFCVQEMNFFGMAAKQPINDNLNFLANVVEQMSGSADMIGIRSRGTFNRPFDRVLELERQARNAWQAREEELTKKLQETQEQLRGMQDQKDANQRFILTPQQQQAIARFRQDEIKVKQDLKEVRKKLRRDVERLGMWVKVINIAMMPLVVSLGGLAYGLARRRRG